MKKRPMKRAAVVRVPRDDPFMPDMRTISTEERLNWLSELQEQQGRGDPSEDEIERSQALIAQVLGPEEIAKLQEQQLCEPKSKQACR